MKIKINNNQKAISLFFEDRFYDTETIIDVPFSTAMRISKRIDTDFYYDRLEYDPEIFHKEKKFSFTGEVDRISGWGNVSYNLLKNSLNYKISLAGKIFDISDRDILRMMHGSFPERGAMIWHEQPKKNWDSSPFPKNIAIVPFETTVIPASWIGKINKFDALLVPCKQNADAFKNSGVTVPIDIIHWGIDAEKFYEIERQKRPIFTFGHMGALSIRKGTDVLIDAFREAFPPHLYPNVRLICKTSNQHYPFMVKDDRIIVQMLPVEHEELMHEFFAQIDCFVYPTRGEGFGLTPLEAMSTGVPAIVTGWSGPEEYMTDEVGWKIKYSMAPAKNFTEQVYKEECGDWAEPDKEHLKELLLYAYNNQDEVKQKGKNAAEHVRKNWTWEKKIKMFHECLNKYL